MNIQYYKQGKTDIVYDADRLLHIDARQFDPAYWRSEGALVGQAKGRGTTWFVRQGDEQWALRHYLRGGLVARLITDHYLWTGLQRTRAWREWHVTAKLHQSGLPVPAPVAARVVRHGLGYSADLITQRIADVVSLSQHLAGSALMHDDWRRLGALLRRFHDAGLNHADLNAHNILVDSRGEFWLIDFDKARLYGTGHWQQDNLLRLRRSLRKLRGQSPHFMWEEGDWAALQSGYSEAGSTRTGRSRV